jgi:RND family efflux transporter MFP subunit
MRSLGMTALLAACNRGGPPASTASNVMVVGPENIAIVAAKQIRSGPAISGTLQAEEQATVRAEVGGAILQTYAEQGDQVRKGEVLARIDDTALRAAELSARAGVTTAQNTVDVDKREVDRNDVLLKAGAIAERDLELTRNQYSAALAQLANAKAVLANAEKQLTKATVIAPFSGVVSARQVSAGDVVQPGGALYTVVNPATMRLEASVPADQLSAVHRGAPVDFTVSGYPDRAFTGHVTQINPVADPATRQVRIIVSLPNVNGVLVGGLFADGHVSSDIRTAPVAPIAAVDETGIAPYVTEIKDGLARRATVTLGIRDAAAETVEIRSGVQIGDTLLVGAARAITQKTPVRVNAIVADTAAAVRP